MGNMAAVALFGAGLFLATEHQAIGAQAGHSSWKVFPARKLYLWWMILGKGSPV